MTDDNFNLIPPELDTDAMERLAERMKAEMEREHRRVSDVLDVESIADANVRFEWRHVPRIPCTDVLQEYGLEDRMEGETPQVGDCLECGGEVQTFAFTDRDGNEQRDARCEPCNITYTTVSPKVEKYDPCRPWPDEWGEADEPDAYEVECSCGATDTVPRGEIPAADDYSAPMTWRCTECGGQRRLFENYGDVYDCTADEFEGVPDSVRDCQPKPDGDVMGFLHSRYGREPEYDPYNERDLADDSPRDPWPGVYRIRLTMATLEYHQSVLGGDDFVSAVEAEGCSKDVVRSTDDVGLGAACDAADEAVRKLCEETMGVIE